MNERTICVAGKNRVAVSALELLSRRGMSVVACPIDADNGVDGSQPSFSRKANDLGCQIVDLRDLHSDSELLLVSLEYDQIIDPSRFASNDLFNIHFSMLPRYRGCLTSIWPILHGEDQSGVTLHRMDHGIDTGPILAQRSIRIFQHTTARELYEMYQDAAVVLFEEMLPGLLAKDLVEQAQDDSLATYFPRSSLSKFNFEIDFSMSASEIVNFVRAFYFPDYQTALYRGSRVLRAARLSERSQLTPGTVLSEGRSSVRLETIDYQLELFLEVDQMGRWTRV